MEATPVIPLMIKVANKAIAMDAKHLVKIWGIPLSIIAERLRQFGLRGVTVKDLTKAECPRQSYLYHLAMRLLIKDLEKTGEVFDGYSYKFV